MGQEAAGTTRRPALGTTREAKEEWREGTVTDR